MKKIDKECRRCYSNQIDDMLRNIRARDIETVFELPFAKSMQAGPSKAMRKRWWLLKVGDSRILNNIIVYDITLRSLVKYNLLPDHSDYGCCWHNSFKNCIKTGPSTWTELRLSELQQLAEHYFSGYGSGESVISPESFQIHQKFQN